MKSLTHPEITATLKYKISKMYFAQKTLSQFYTRLWSTGKQVQIWHHCTQWNVDKRTILRSCTSKYLNTYQSSKMAGTEEGKLLFTSKKISPSDYLINNDSPMKVLCMEIHGKNKDKPFWCCCHLPANT